MKNDFMTGVPRQLGSKFNLKYLNHISLVLVSSLIYLWSMPRSVVLEDDGLFILASYFNSFAHPPGYPLYTLFAHQMTLLPIDSVAFKVHMTSAFFGAAGVLMVYCLIRKLVKSNTCAYLTALVFSISNVYWSQSIIAEVYTLNLFIVLLLLLLAVYYSESDHESSKRMALWIGLLYGLGLSNHWPLMILSTPMFLAVVWPRFKSLLNDLVYIVPMVVVGLLPYAWMFFRSQMPSVISFYGPLESWTDFWFFVSREGYAELDHSTTSGWLDKIYFCGFVVQETARQFSYIGGLFILIGFLRQWKRFSVNICVGLILGYLGSTLILILLLGFDYEYLHRAIFRVYPLVPYSISAIWLALGMREVIILIGNKVGTQKERLLFAFYILIFGLTFLGNIERNYRASDDWVEKYAKTILDNIPRDSILFTDGDLDLATLAYFNRIQNYRDDITLYSTKGIIFPNRLFTPGKTPDQERVVIINDFLKTAKRPVYYTWNLPHLYGEINFGLFNKVEINKAGDSRIAYAKEEIVAYIKNVLVQGEPVDPWEKMHYYLLLADYCNLSLNLLANTRPGEYYNELEEWVDLVCSSYHGQLKYAEVLLKEDNLKLEKINGLLNNASKMEHQIVIKSEAAMFPYLVGELEFKARNKGEAIENYKRSIDIWPHGSNPAYEKLDSLLN